MGSPAVSRRVARALYATPNALDPALLNLVQVSSLQANSFEELPQKVRDMVLWVEQYIGAPAGASGPEAEEAVLDGEAGA